MTQHSLLQTPSSPVFGWAHALLASIGIIQPPNTSTFLLWQHSVLMPTTSISTYVHVIPILYWDWRDLSIHTFSVFIFDSLTFQEPRKVQISFPLQANNLVGCSFMDTEIRYRTPGSDIEDFIVTEVVVKGPTNLGQFLWAQFLETITRIFEFPVTTKHILKVTPEEVNWSFLWLLMAFGSVSYEKQ